MNCAWKGIVLSAAMVALPATSACAVSLYWGDTPVKTGSFATCISFAGDAMRLANVQNIRKLPNEVAGTLGNNYAAITCVGTSPNATAIVMVAGENGVETMRLRDTLKAKIAGMIRFD
jgi:hypothetical protein